MCTVFEFLMDTKAKTMCCINSTPNSVVKFTVHLEELKQNSGFYKQS